MKLEFLKLRKDKIEQFNRKGINSIEDLLDFIPRKYYDFLNPTEINDLKSDEYQAVIGTISKIEQPEKDKYGKIPKTAKFKVILEDKYFKKIHITFFNQPYLAKTLSVGGVYLACGLVKILPLYHNMKVMSNPVIFTNKVNSNLKLLPVYSNVSGMTNNFLLDKINSAVALVNKDDYIENILLAKYKLIPKYKAITKLHQPLSLNDIDEGQKRLLFDDLFKFNFKLKESQDIINRHTEIEVKSFLKAKELMDNLPFQLTDGQRAVLRDLSTKMLNKQRINALVQGDVGSGKTLVAFLLMVTICENGYQSCLVAPTNILAKQHYEELKERAEPLGFRIGFLSASLKAKEKKEIFKQIKSGELDIIVGTHSLMSDKLEFNNLGLAIIDEEHRFGVTQRDILNRDGVHAVTMSATPIPRSLALTMYGESVDVETINTLPKGRKDILTQIISTKEEQKAYDKMLEEVKNGRQCYIVCPLINKSESEKLENVCNIYDEYKKANKFFNKHGYKVGVIDGKMKEDEVSSEIDKFKNKEYDVLVATTIIEVGVNIPNSTVITIQNAERFGFAQLHQLRGRVGRSDLESFCYLITDTKDKFEIFTKTRDGFQIAKEDLILRGAGNFLGTQQSGSNKFLMLMLANPNLNESIRNDIVEIFKDSKRFENYTDWLKEEILNESESK